LTSLVGGNWSKSIRKYDMLIVHQLWLLRNCEILPKPYFIFGCEIF
jgi:hypothetical protein